MLYVPEDIPANVLSLNFPTVENFFVENYADDTTPYFVGSTTAEVLENLSCLTKKLFSWIANNQMKANDDKCHLILSSPDEDAVIQMEESTIKYFKIKKLLVVRIDYKLKCDTHMLRLYVKKPTENSKHF